MRYPLNKFPEIVDAYARDNLYFAAIRLIRLDSDRVFELGISEASYRALRRLFQLRPFDKLPGIKYRYFFDSCHSRRDDPNRCIGTIRIEQGRDARNFQVELPEHLIANLLWFYEMESHVPASHLHSWPHDAAQ